MWATQLAWQLISPPASHTPCTDLRLSLVQTRSSKTPSTRCAVLSTSGCPADLCTLCCLGRRHSAAAPALVTTSRLASHPAVLHPGGGRQPRRRRPLVQPLPLPLPRPVRVPAPVFTASQGGLRVPQRHSAWPSCLRLPTAILREARQFLVDSPLHVAVGRAAGLYQHVWDICRDQPPWTS